MATAIDAAWEKSPIIGSKGISSSGLVDIKQQKNEPARRYDAGKPRFELIPPDALIEVAKVYEMGAEKYDADNWVKGMSWRRVVGSMLRHTMSWLGGEDVDKESGVAHMAHVAWGALTLIAYGKRGVGVDDRVKV